MSQNIHILPEQLCNQIAAGEVVERPASVVKELLENSLDAGATEICIEVEKGGKRLIRITDDGCGMGRDDAFLSLERHATSKIRNESDLFALHTLGFRGEALPSIASVCRMLLQTCAQGGEEGWEIYAEGGHVKRAGAMGIPPGTSIEVRDLFFNTPARRKFLRKDETEFGHIADIVTRLALASPEVQFRLLHNGRPLIEVYRQSGLVERIGALLGRPLLADLLPVDSDGGGDLKLQGFVSQPAIHRSTTGAMYTFINGRYIRDRVVQHALLDGYRNVLVKGRYPVVVLFLDIDPALVDVNVHPTKHEVRFRDQRLIHDFITSTVRDVLRPSGWLREPSAHTGSTIDGAPPPSERSDVPAATAVEPVRDYHKEVQESLQLYARTQSPAVAQGSQLPRSSVSCSYPQAVSQPDDAQGFFSSLRIIGQFRNSYIVCQDGNDLVLVDQHAAHERIGFERLRGQYLSGNIERQALLFPVVIELDFREVDQFAGQLEKLDRLGFDIEHFGGKSFVLKGVPQCLDQTGAEQLVRDIAAEITLIGKSVLAEESLDKVFILMACHGVIRANRSLTIAEMSALLKDLDAVDFNAHCPHGRPVMVRQSLADIDKMFKRS
jgi:DNA mismatch repair protein MutL